MCLFDYIVVSYIGFCKIEFHGSSESDHRIDVFSFGLVLLHMATGQSPEDKMQSSGLDPVTIARLVMEGESIPVPDEAALARHSDLVRVAQYCVAMTPNERSSMAEATEDFWPNFCLTTTIDSF